MSETKGITELMEILEAVEVIVTAGKEVMKDGKVDLSDLAVLVKLASQVEVLVKAVEGAQEVVGEAKDLDAAEVITVVQKLYAISAKVKAA